MMPSEWRDATPRELVKAIFENGKVRVLTRDDIARHLFEGSKSPIRSSTACLQKMSLTGEVRLTSAMLVPNIDISAPLFEWTPGSDYEPDFGAISWKANSRFSGFPVRTVVVMPGPSLRTRKWRGLRSTETQHDALLGSVFMNLVSQDRTAFDHWHHEDELGGEYQFAGHIPDAVLDGHPTRIIECIGSYPKKKLEAIHKAYRHASYLFF